MCQSSAYLCQSMSRVQRVSSGNMNRFFQFAFANILYCAALLLCLVLSHFFLWFFPSLAQPLALPPREKKLGVCLFFIHPTDKGGGCAFSIPTNTTRRPPGISRARRPRCNHNAIVYRYRSRYTTALCCTGALYTLSYTVSGTIGGPGMRRGLTAWLEGAQARTR